LNIPGLRASKGLEKLYFVDKLDENLKFINTLFRINLTITISVPSFEICIRNIQLDQIKVEFNPYYMYSKKNLGAFMVYF